MTGVVTLDVTKTYSIGTFVQTALDTPTELHGRKRQNRVMRRSCRAPTLGQTRPRHTSFAAGPHLHGVQLAVIGPYIVSVYCVSKHCMVR